MEGVINQMLQFKAIGIHQASNSRSGQFFHPFITILNINTPSTVTDCPLKQMRMLIVLLCKTYRTAV